ncbi:DUF6352 family protein [Fodinicurvata sediminis]|uniref:DUF6352 family protein n=1 Tax=Fodinicurvata sediminis TaxID=1121832 RepID=UPI0003B3DEA5|nr:DUF6352 family protein [Fodinicurvata sediminis]
MPDFWRDSGYHLLEQTPEGRLKVTDDFLRAYLVRPEMRPPEEACKAERHLHADLLESPRMTISDQRLETLADPDAVDNYKVWDAYRARLLDAETLEEVYMGLFVPEEGVTNDRAANDSGVLPVPPIFIDHLSHIIMRHILGEAADPLAARAGELFFREQKVTLREGQILLADSDTVEMYATQENSISLGNLLAQSEGRARSLELDVLSRENADIYWERDTRYDTVLRIDFGSPGLDAFCRALEKWVTHFLDIEVRVQPIPEIKDDAWVWYVGLDAEATALLNTLYRGQEASEDQMYRLLGLFRSEFADSSVVLPQVAGRPLYMALCMDEAGGLRFKPQNLLCNLPLSARA